MSAHAHAHHACGHGHGHAHGPDTGALLAWAFVINAAFMAVEFAGGWWTGSLALMADAGHMLNDALSLAAAWGALRLSRRAADGAFTFGYRRAQVLAALANAVSLGAIIAFILAEAIHRLAAPSPIRSGEMLAIALLGLAANLGSGMLLFPRRGESLNIRGAFLHLMADTLGSVAAVGAALAIRWTGETRIDPILGLLIAALVAWSAWGLMRDSLGVLMERAPAGFSTAKLSEALLKVEGVASIHDLHVWQLDDGAPLASVHVVLRDGVALDERAALARCQAILRERFQVAHATIQVESAGWPECGTKCEIPGPPLLP